MIRFLPALVLLAGAIACSNMPSSNQPAVSEDQIVFSHARHLKADAECLACHEEIYEAATLDGNYRPAEDICLGCHKEEKTNNKCEFCHTKVASAAAWPARERPISINHEDHIELVDEDCARCHKALPESRTAQNLVPPMAACLSCHEHQQEYEEGRCQTCHTDMSKYPLKPVSVFSHEGNFVETHRLSARSSANICATCHDQTFCADCHSQTVAAPIELLFPERLDRGFIHRNDFVTRHVIEAAADPATCNRCHGTSFCDGCHRSQNLTPFGVDPRDPHPPGWSFPGAAEFHGPAARNDIASCAACHDQGARSVCVNCHASGGIGGNPHPLSWLESHDVSEIRSNGMCRYCHI